MALTDCDEQSVAEALRVKGDDTVAPLAGLLTLTPSELTSEVLAAFATGVAEALTVRATSVTHDAPSFPHALTCRVCAPVADVTRASIEVALTMVVSVLLSSENPIELTGWSEQVVATAESVNCVGTTALFEGVLTVTLARAGIAPAARRKRAV